MISAFDCIAKGTLPNSVEIEKPRIQIGSARYASASCVTGWTTRNFSLCREAQLITRGSQPGLVRVTWVSARTIVVRSCFSGATRSRKLTGQFRFATLTETVGGTEAAGTDCPT